MMWSLLLSVAFGWSELGEGGTPNGREWDAGVHFVEGVLPVVPVRTDPAALGRIAARTAAALRACGRPAVCQPGALSELGVDLERVLATLDLVARVAEEDRGKDAQRLQDPAWLAETFQIIGWRPDTERAKARKVTVTDRAIRLTKYLVYQVKGSLERTERFDTALYAVDEAADDAWTRHTRVDAYAGVFEPGGTAEGLLQPLVYLTRQGVNRALMQGTVEVELPDGARRLFNVHKNNGIPWDPAQPDGNLQKRYWTFQERPGIVGVEGVVLEPGATVAGDIYNVGFGKLIALHTSDGMRLAVLADTGGAFQPNLFQLDWLAGTFPSHEAYEAGVAHLPRRTQASVLVVR